MPRNTESLSPGYEPAKSRRMAAMIAAVAREGDLPQDHVRRVVEHFLEVLRDEVWQQGRVEVRNFGTFTVRRRKGKPMNLNGQRVEVPPAEVVKFRASKNWRTK